MLLFFIVPTDRKPPREDPFETLYKTYSAEMIRVAESVFHNPRDAEDREVLMLVRPIDRFSSSIQL